MIVAAALRLSTKTLSAPDILLPDHGGSSASQPRSVGTIGSPPW
jgi:hypothetical protein